ncbi:MAG: hypothetical protein ACI3Z5_04465 [Paludibacteraceae bacterium]
MRKKLEIKHDKFHAKTEMITRGTTLWSGNKLYDYGFSWKRNDIRGKFRHWSTPEGDSILLDIDFVGTDWMFLEQGDIVIRVNDTKNITIKPVETDSKVSSDEHAVHVHESLYYEVPLDDFKDICEATAVEVQISGKNTFVEGNGVALQEIGRYLYNQLFTNKALPEIKVSSKKSLTLSIILAIIAEFTLLLTGVEWYIIDRGFTHLIPVVLLVLGIDVFCYIKSKAYNNLLLNILFLVTWILFYCLLEAKWLITMFILKYVVGIIISLKNRKTSKQ